MYRTIYVPVDNSDFSNAAIDLALTFGKVFDSRLVGSHVYAAKLHDVRFKQMEFTLPDEYKEETELEKQRKIHDALIGRGLHLISDSYLDQMDTRAQEAKLPFERKHFDGKNFEAIVRDVNDCAYDLVILGALGQGAVNDSLVGSVVERLLRRTVADTLVVRDLSALTPGGQPPSGRITVCLDGSAHSYAGLVTACRLASSFAKSVEILAAAPSGSDEVALLRAHLEVAERHARSLGITATSRLLDGSSRDALTDEARREPPWLLVVGRSGIDGVEEGNGQTDAPVIGSTTEHLVRYAPCNVLVSGRAPATAPAELLRAN
jgi:nucleotide-binding universal stress UspA family protein